MVSIKEEDEEDEEPHPQQQNHIHHHHYSEEEEEDQAKPEMESESSPLRSPIQSHSHHPEPLQSINSHPHPHENLSQIIAMDRQIHGFSPLRSPPPAPPPQNHNHNNNTNKKRPIRPPPPLPLPLEPTPTPMESVQVNPLSPVIVVNRSIREELSAVSKMDAGENGLPGGAPPPPPPGAGGGSRRVRGDVEYGDRKSRRVSSILYQERKEARLKRAALGFRVCEAIFCLISFSVMAADKTQGWAGDSFDRYKEYRYCLSVTVIGFAYAGFQAFDLAYNLVSGTHVMQDHIRIYSDFFMDQVLTYLLISASSAAASRVDEWQSNWGKDEFTIMASASIGMSFLAFVAFAFSSLISGHNLCTYNSQT